MSTVIESTHSISPVISITVCVAVPAGLTVMHIFALTVFKLTEIALSILNTHLSGSRHIAVVLGIGIYFSRLLNGFDKLDCFFKVLTG